ncbi:DNA repair protein RecO [Nocardioidaceae bacterium]|nr:DNA repair protein RecO [Nocardioidaceae bacterium]
MPLYRDEAVVLRTHKLGEADRILTLLTRRSGRVRAVARGIRRTTSKFGARLEPFSHVDLQLAEGRTLDVVTQAVTLTPFALRLGGDYERYTAGTVMLETAGRVVPEEGEPATAQHQLLVGALRALTGGERTATEVLDSYLLRALATAGFAPSFEACARCGELGDHRAFSAMAGGILCTGCRVPGAAHPQPETVRLLGALLTGDWDTAAGADARHRREASGLVAAYVSWHLERGLTSLAHLDRG